MNGKWSFGQAVNLYLSDVYKPVFSIEGNLNGVLTAADFVSEAYLPDGAKAVEEEAKWIGMAPAVKSIAFNLAKCPIMI